MQTDLLIIGAGPAGLLAACWASQYPISTRIIDKNAARKPTGHADGIHSRTLEILDSFGIVDRITKLGVASLEMCYWDRDGENGQLQREKRLETQPEGLSRFSQYLLNQGVMEQVMIDYLNERGVRIEWSTRAESLDMDEESVMAHVNRGHDTEKQTIRSRYMIACDGTHSWTRERLQIPMDASEEDSTWGVMDVVPITDFPDIRQSCAIRALRRGSIMQLPRENRLVRLYIQLIGDKELEEQHVHDSETPRRLLRIAQKTYEPYRLDYEHCDWWSLYRIGQQLVPQYRVHDRVFLAGDAAHTHSPKGGQGMNVSMQDTYNLVWKLASVLTGCMKPSILETYDTERRPVAQELMRMDSELVHVYEQQSARQHGHTTGVDEIRQRYMGFMTGVTVTYPPTSLVADSKGSVARNIELGMRLPSFKVENQASGCPQHLAERLVSNGYWRIILFSGDLREEKNRGRLASAAKDLQYLVEPLSIPVEMLLIHASPRTDVGLLHLPGIFHPFNDQLGWDYSRVYADVDAYEGYGVEDGSVVVCRPDQHVGWVGCDVTELEEYLYSEICPSL